MSALRYGPGVRSLHVVPILVVFGVAVSAGACSSPTTTDHSSDAGADRRAPNVEPDDAGVPATGPSLLSDTGLYSDFAGRVVAPENVAFAPRFELWADGAKKSRWLYLPPGTTIDTSKIDHWVFPVGTKAWKEFRVGDKLVETRLLMKVTEAKGDLGWWMVAYVWKEDGSDAVATVDGRVDALGTSHDVPKQTDCVNCHQDVRDVLVGVSAIQLRDPANDQLAAFAAAGRLSTAPPAGIDVPGTGDVQAALGYLHANCGHCHNDEAIRLKTQTDVRLRLLADQKTPEQTGAYRTTIGTVMKHPLPGGVTTVIVPGSPETSGLWVRMGRRDNFGMPPAGTETVDDVGREKVRLWIAGLSP